MAVWWTASEEMKWEPRAQQMIGLRQQAGHQYIRAKNRATVSNKIRDLGMERKTR